MCIMCINVYNVYSVWNVCLYAGILYVYLCTCVFVCVCVFVYVCIWVYVHMCVSIFDTYICVCVCPCMYASLSFRQTWNWCLSTQQFHASWTLRTMPASQANRFWKTNVLAEPDPVLETGTHCTNNQELCCTPEHRQKPIVMSRLEVQKPTVYLYG